MKVLITGATGFIGNYVVKELLQQQDCEIIIASRNNNLLDSWKSNYKLSFQTLDLDNLDESQNYFDKLGKPDKLIHLAWQGLPNYKQLFHFEDNLPKQYKFIKNLIVNGLQSITITGTCLEYGMQEGCLGVQIPVKPNNPYALAKYTLYCFLTELKKQHPFQFNWLRLFYMFGKGQSPNSLYSQLDAAIERRDAVFNMSGGEQERDFLPVETVAKKIVMAAISKNEIGLVNCCSGQPIKVKDWVQNYINEKGSNIRPNLGFYPYPDYEPMCFWG